MKLIPICQHSKTVAGKLSTMVDDSDFEWLMQWKWRLSHGYVARNQYCGGGRNSSIQKDVKMAREIMRVSDLGRNVYVDHIDQNPMFLHS